MVTVVDAANLLRDYASTDFLKDRGEALGEEDNRALVNLLVDQIEFADVIVLNKIDAATPAQLDAARTIIRSLNPDAELVETSMSRVSLDKVLNTGRFDHAKAQEHPLWFKGAVRLRRAQAGDRRIWGAQLRVSGAPSLSSRQIPRLHHLVVAGDHSCQGAFSGWPAVPSGSAN